MLACVRDRYKTLFRVTSRDKESKEAAKLAALEFEEKIIGLAS